MSRLLRIEHLGRVEGHGGITVELEGDAVTNVRFDVFEGLRLIEAFDAEVRDHTSYDNGADGILVNEGANNVVRSSAVTNNALSGISVCVDTRLNRVEHNTATGNGSAGIAVCSQATDTAVTNNRATNNKVDALDESMGTGTAGTDSYWKNNFCNTSNPTGLCRSTGR